MDRPDPLRKAIDAVRLDKAMRIVARGITPERASGALYRLARLSEEAVASRPEAHIMALARALLGAGADVDFRDSKTIGAAVGGAFVELVRWLLDAGASMDAVGWHQCTLLHTAINSSRQGSPQRLAVVRLLLEAGADVNATDAYGQTPLHYYCIRKFLPLCATITAEERAEHDATSMINLLLDAGANPDARDNSGQLPRDCSRSFMGHMGHMGHMACVETYDRLVGERRQRAGRHTKPARGAAAPAAK